ncbi:WSC-domain-containing protein [Colletotrichum eremochloae]|nr:WSC-domain-containing protein [Colletotrichum eremochloae]
MHIKMHPKAVFFQLVVFGWLPGFNSQSVQCVTVPDGCDSGSRNQAGIESAIARFQDGMIYGGSDSIVMASAPSGGSLAMITYLCNDGSVPPKLEGSVIRSNFQKVLSCPNQCGGVAYSDNANCGFGVLVANNAAGADCFSKAVNVEPRSSSPKIVPSAGAYKDPVCLFDAPGSRVLTGGSSEDQSGMTVEKCIAQAAADGWRYAGVEFGRECFWGDVQVNPERSNQADCNTVCAGNPDQVCGGGNRILVYENSNLHGVSEAKASVENYRKDPTNSILAQTAKDAIDTALDTARNFFSQITNSAVKAAQQQLIQDLTAASSTAATAVAAASAAIAAVLADQIAKAVASEEAVQNAKNQKPTQSVSLPPSTITRPPTSTAKTTTSSSSSSTSSACSFCISCADDQFPEIGPDDSTTVPADDVELDELVPDKRQVGQEEKINNQLFTLGRRVTDSKKEIKVCSTEYQSGPYLAGNAGNRFPAYGYSYRVSPQTACVWRFDQLTWKPNQLGAPAATKGAEHVYEAQLVRQFAEHIGTLDTGNPCRPAGLIVNILARTTSFPGRSSNPFASRGKSALGQMMLNIPDNNSGAGNGAELVALDKELNILKAAVFNSATESFSSANVASGKLAKVTRFAMLYAYLAEPEVVAIFKATSARMRATLRLLDQEIAASTITKPGIQFENVYSVWEDNLLFQQGALVETEMDSIIKAAIAQLKTDTTLGSQTLRDSYVKQVQALTAFGASADPSKWFDLDDLFRP